jgi:hypothetical protein
MDRSETRLRNEIEQRLKALRGELDQPLAAALREPARLRDEVKHLCDETKQLRDEVKQNLLRSELSSTLLRELRDRSRHRGRVVAFKLPSDVIKKPSDYRLEGRAIDATLYG